MSDDYELKLLEQDKHKGEVKVCFRCKEEKPLDLFWKYARGKDGRDGFCKQCRKDSYKKTSLRIAIANGKKRWLEKNKHKQKAYAVVASLKKSGKLKQESCFFCQEKDTEAHHMLYEFPDKVVWLCPKHHKQVHLEGQTTNEQ